MTKFNSLISGPTWSWNEYINLDFQKQAIESVAGIFEGQEIYQTNFTVAPLQYTKEQFLSGIEDNLGIGNRRKLHPEDILKNIRKIQLKNGLHGFYRGDGNRYGEDLCLSAFHLRNEPALRLHQSKITRPASKLACDINRTLTLAVTDDLSNRKIWSEHK